MTPQTGEKPFDVMKWLRETRARHYEETKDMSWEERCEWYSRRPKDPVLARLLDRRKAPEGGRVRAQAAEERGDAPHR